MGALTWKHWLVGALTAAVVAALVVWLVVLRDGSGDAPVIADPAATVSETEEASPEPSHPVTEPSTTEPEPTATETATERPSEVAGATWLVTTDGQDVVLRSDTRGDAVTLYESPDAAETEVVHVAVRPGSTTSDLTVVFTRTGEGMRGGTEGMRGGTEGMRGGTEGMFDLAYATIRDRGDPEVRSLPDRYQVSKGTDPASRPFPVWSPDGRHLAWTELPNDGGAVVMRTIGWDDGPGTGDDASDNAAFEIEELPTLATTVEEWVWNGEGSVTTGSLVVTTDELEAFRVDIERQADGALARPAEGGVHAMPHPEGPVVDQADGRTGPTPETSSIYTLVAAGGGEGTVDLQLTVVEGSDQGDELPVPEEFEATSDPGSRWIVAEADTVLIGDGGGAAWLVHRDGEVTELSGTVVSGDLVS